ncbi:alpha/beta fold hydrolase [Sutcliffiella rhizosphaerae]|uniref:Serine hydrolase family protein n=1 Tax=Sutcliffiella rhizosphaerae TaxID=2880967 RepID=A0ABN8AED8_9BACI|nr:alpha/beta hydrolase [Sutcliffiella rhizosphaerae]CAG9622691.1 hypothetical protein BACCIP111883_03482 [Sutcliffiella rhizosphaerae]
MKKNVLFIHSAGVQGLHQGSSDLITYLKESLGDEYSFICPKMPNLDFMLWEDLLVREFAALDGEVLLISHSLGGSVLVKYLSEKTINCSISGLFLIAAPFWGKDDDWQVNEYILRENFPTTLPHISQVFLYHSRNDKVVPFAHLGHYKQTLPMAKTHILDDDGHYFNNGLPKLVADIKEL